MRGRPVPAPTPPSREQLVRRLQARMRQILNREEFAAWVRYGLTRAATGKRDMDAQMDAITAKAYRDPGGAARTFVHSASITRRPLRAELCLAIIERYQVRSAPALLAFR